jgi:glycosyltransferase involved in cell wall biosynthesis
MAAALRREAPANLECVGRLDSASLAEFLRKARVVFVPSVAYETFSLATLEAMSHGVPVVASAIGAIPEIVGEDGGLLYPPGDARAAKERISRIWTDDALCAALGQAARRHAAVYCEDFQYEKLMIAYRAAAERATASIRTGEAAHAL